MTDLIRLHGLRVLVYCGALPEEQQRRQPFEIDIDIMTDLAGAGASDDLADTIDYGAVTDAVSRLATDGRFVLMERLAAAVAASVLADDRVGEVTVEVRKLRPPVPDDLRTSAVRITRSRR